MKEEDFKQLRTEVLRKVGLVNMSLRKNFSYAESLKLNDIGREKLELMGWKYNCETKQVERVNYINFNDLKEQFLDSDSYEQTKDI